MDFEGDFEILTDDRQRRNNGQVAYTPRSGEDLEELVENMHRVPSSREEDSVKGLMADTSDDSEDLDRLLRTTVGVHARAPIRSMNNPMANVVSTEDGRELQVTGEEYFVNQNSEQLGDFMDISNVKVWKLEENGVSGEERRNDREGEHITLDADSRFGVEGFYVEVDGESLDAREVESFKRSISRRNNATVAPPNEVPGMVLTSDSVEDAVMGRDISRSEFEDQYEDALEYGLVTEDADLTLKGWLSAVNMHAPDLRVFEDLDSGSDHVSFPQLTSQNLEQVLDTETIGKTGSITLNVTLPGGDDAVLASQEYSGEVLYSDGDEPRVEGFEGLREFLSERGGSVVDRFYEVTSDDVFGTSNAMDVDLDDLEDLGLGLEPTDSGEDDLCLLVGADENEDYESILDLIEDGRASIEDLNYELIDTEVDAFGDAPIDRIMDVFDYDAVESKLEEIIDSYEMSIIDDPDQPGHVSDQAAVEMNLEHESLVNEHYSERERNLHWLGDGTKGFTYVSGFKAAGENIFEEDRSEIELIPLLIDQISEDIEEQGGEIITNYGKVVEVEGYDEFDEDLQEKLDILDEAQISIYDQSESKRIYGDNGPRVNVTREPEVELRLDAEGYLEAETDAEIDSRAYRNSEKMQEVASALDPLDFDKPSYEDVILETGFEYEEN